MDVQAREDFWKAVESGEDPLLSAMNSLVERWGLPALIMSMGSIAQVLSEDALDADLTPNQRGLILSACAQVANLSDLMHAEMAHLQANG